jgi:hypothetical protein
MRQIRSSKIFDDPFTLTPLLSIDRNMLNQTVVNFYYVMQDNYDSYLTDRSKSSLKPIFVTHDLIQHIPVNGKQWCQGEWIIKYF